MIEYQYRKNIYLLLIIAVGFLLAQYWMQESRSGVPEQFQKSLQVVAPKAHPQAKQASTPMPLISVSNDVLRLWINPRGGSVVRADLLRYKKNLSGNALVSVLGLNSLGQRY